MQIEDVEDICRRSLYRLSLEISLMRHETAAQAPTNAPPSRTPGSAGLASDSGSCLSSRPPLYCQSVLTPNYFEHNGAREGSDAQTDKDVDRLDKFENFRRQSESQTFSLNQGSLSSLSMANSQPPNTASQPESRENENIGHHSPRPLKVGKKHQQDSPCHSGDEGLHTVDGLARPAHERRSRPSNRLIGLSTACSLPNSSTPPTYTSMSRAETFPTSPEPGQPRLISPSEIISFLEADKALVLDLRTFAQFSQSRIQGALNLCIPTTLLRRPAYNIPKLSDTFANKPDEKAVFDAWSFRSVIIAYDAVSRTLAEATSCVHILKKFSSQGFEGRLYTIKGGFEQFAKQCPQFVCSKSSSSNAVTAVAPVAGGCIMPSTKNAANPFFGSIRQNMDLIDGVGQISVQLPSNMDSEKIPKWLREATDAKDRGKLIAERFLQIEKDEQKRMKQALTVDISYDGARPQASGVQIAGIEKGGKNRYKDILPFDHSRVRLASRGCDYINASHIRPHGSSKHYIAAQAPVPGTFDDFWHSVWEQDVRIIVMLTAESEGGNIKSHPYWIAAKRGDVDVHLVSEKTILLDSHSTALSAPYSADNKHFFGKSEQPKNSVTVRILDIIQGHSTRRVTQIHYSAWPDFGAPARARDLLALVELCGIHAADDAEACRDQQRPILVHCSAGCGRTGAFCTVDTVVECLKRQTTTDESTEDDLIAATVADLRCQRISMVQTLRQFVLCYESVLEWCISH